MTSISAVSTLDLVSTPRSSRRRGAVTIASAVALSCTAAKTSPQAVERELRSRLDELELPRATRSPLDELPVGARVQLRDGLVELDDVSSWAALTDEQLLHASETPWTRVTELPIEPQGPASDVKDPALLAAMQRVHAGSVAALELRASGAHPPYTVLVEADASYLQAVRLLYAASRAGHSHAWLAARTSDGTLGALPVGTWEACEEDEDRRRERLHTARCFEAVVMLVDDTTVHVKGRPSTEHDGDCVHVTRARPFPTDITLPIASASGLSMESPGTLDDADAWSELFGTEAHDAPRVYVRPPARPPAPPPPPPCRTLETRRLGSDPQALRRAIESLAEYDPPCRHASLVASDAVRWQDVLTTFDLMRSLGHDWIALEARDTDAAVGCTTVN